MRIDEQIKIMCIKANMSVAEMGRKLHKSPQAFGQKIKRGTFTLDELDEIASIAGCDVKCEFVYPDGEVLKVK